MGFSKGWQGYSKGFLIGKALGKSQNSHKMQSRNYFFTMLIKGPLLMQNSKFKD